jgi:hypothetical protein
MNVIGYWFSDRLALKAGRAQPVVAGTMPELERWCRKPAQTSC